MGGERETLDIDVLFVGAGPASLAGAYHLANLVRRHNQQAAKPFELSIAVLEKGREAGSPALSGAVVDPRAFGELFPDDWRSAPFEAPVGKEQVLLLTAGGAHSLPIPPPLQNHGCYVASLGKLVKWMAPRVEAAGVDVFYEFPAVEALIEQGRVVGVRTGDRGIGKHGEKKANYQPGIQIRPHTGDSFPYPSPTASRPPPRSPACSPAASRPSTVPRRSPRAAGGRCPSWAATASC